MRKLIVSNLMSLDGYYEGKDRNLNALFDYFHEDYAGDENFDYYNAERMRAADTLIFSGRTSFMGNKEYWSGVPNDPTISVIRHEIAEIQKNIEKIVVSDHLTQEDLVPWADTTRIVKREDTFKEIATLKQQPGRDIFMFMSRLL
ncbi:MAG: deaminase, partial [Chloroflexota bacterium]